MKTGICVSNTDAAKSDMEPKAGDDAAEAHLFTRGEIIKMNLEGQVCFDHGTILADYFSNTF